MKRLIHSLVLICLLGSNMAWAWDNHPEILTGHVVVESSLSAFVDTIESADSEFDKTEFGTTEFDTTEVDASTPHDHYCCCGHAHVVAIAITMPAFEHCKAVKSEQFYLSTQLNYIPSLPSKPPRI